ncbi:MAG: hypothetical protein EPN50_10585 [Chloroflexota bacterium]|nr:MAG: hypothetical protein EPN50_10585 [Chloroflexota bacterium]
MHPLRAQAERRLGRHVPDAAWRLAERRDYVTDAALTGEDGMDQLVAFLDGFRAAAPPPRGRTTDTSAWAQERTLAVTRLAAAAATDDPEVHSFRAEVLRHAAPLSAAEATALLESPLAREVPASHLGLAPWPIVGHQARLQAPGGTTYTVSWADGSDTVVLPARDPLPRLSLAYVQADDRVRTVEVSHDSVLGRLAELSETLAKSYPWEPALAAAFVLEGAAPWASGIRVTRRQWMPLGRQARPPRARITIEVEAWVPADVVTRAYRESQREVLDGHNRPLAERSIQLVNFVLDARDAEPNVTWPALRERWNRAHPAAPFPNFRNMRFTFERASRSILYPRYRLGGRS